MKKILTIGVPETCELSHREIKEMMTEIRKDYYVIIYDLVEKKEFDFEVLESTEEPPEEIQKVIDQLKAGK
jgi:hypothetical protein